MTLQDLIQHFRSQTDDEAAPFLTTEDEALLYAIDAQDQLVKAMGGISDMTAADPDQSQLPDLTAAVGEPYAALSPFILRVRSARLLTAGRDLEVINEADMPAVAVRDYGWTQGATLDDTDTGEVRWLVLGIRENYVRFLRVPDTADTCRLHVFRMPYPRIETKQDELEVDAQHHIHLVKWMKHLAYSKEDAEIYDKKSADSNEASFRAYCEQARSEKERRRYKPRSVRYGGL